MDFPLSSMPPQNELADGDTRRTARERRHQRRHPGINGNSTHARAVRDTLVRAVLAIVFVVLSVAAFFYASVQAAGAYSLAQHYHATQGQVTQTQCSTRLQVDYAFLASGVPYRGSGVAHKRCESYRIGETVAVYFSPESPGHNLSEVTPEQEWHTRLALLLAGTGVVATMVLMLVLRRRN